MRKDAGHVKAWNTIHYYYYFRPWKKLHCRHPTMKLASQCCCCCWLSWLLLLPDGFKCKNRQTIMNNVVCICVLEPSYGIVTAAQQQQLNECVKHDENKNPMSMNQKNDTSRTLIAGWLAGLACHVDRTPWCSFISWLTFRLFWSRKHDRIVTEAAVLKGKASPLASIVRYRWRRNWQLWDALVVDHCWVEVGTFPHVFSYGW